MTYSPRRDRMIADEQAPDADLMCQANGCPNRWSVDGGSGRLCSAHAWSARHLWPQITQEQLDAETERAIRSQHSPSAPVVLSAAEKRDVIRNLSTIAQQFGGRSTRSWAYALRDREQKGERLTDAQRTAWRAAISAHDVLDDVREGADMPTARITEALQVTGDLPTRGDRPWTDIDDVPAFEEHA